MKNKSIEFNVVFKALNSMLCLEHCINALS